ncbi:MAG TPA: 16S rRNA (cytosine(1402)-N(4))-methyltransferase RsmH [Candidatus Acidoferrales bacterium]|nr:16S rRNA (cytosine(1402)-N(4))-methyltransferase RsmH [Candidatus Acidoferrales bacterium]
MGEGSTDTPQGVGHGGGREASHVPVLLKEAIDFLNVRRGGTYIDATVGLGGHSYEIAKRLGAPGHLIGLDKDPAALQIAGRKLAPAKLEGSTGVALANADWPKVTLMQSSFAEVGERFGKNFADGLLADIGVNSLQLQDAARGFSFQADGPLDMRMDPRSERTAEQVVNHLDERELADVIYEFGEERRSRRIARAIVRSRPIRSTAHFADVISAAARPMNSEQRRIHPATRTFQALRIFVNRELDDLTALMNAAPRILKPGGRVVVISFHSLEDRIVKDAFREAGNKYKYFRVLTKKPVTASEEEQDRNPRARSAKMRAAEKV